MRRNMNPKCEKSYEYRKTYHELKCLDQGPRECHRRRRDLDMDAETHAVMDDAKIGNTKYLIMWKTRRRRRRQVRKNMIEHELHFDTGSETSKDLTQFLGHARNRRLHLMR